jgi:hypothetical protein
MSSCAAGVRGDPRAARASGAAGRRARAYNEEDDLVRLGREPRRAARVEAAPLGRVAQDRHALCERLRAAVGVEDGELAKRRGLLALLPLVPANALVHELDAADREGEADRLGAARDEEVRQLEVLGAAAAVAALAHLGEEEKAEQAEDDERGGLRGQVGGEVHRSRSRSRHRLACGRSARVSSGRRPAEESRFRSDGELERRTALFMF